MSKVDNKDDWVLVANAGFPSLEREYVLTEDKASDIYMTFDPFAADAP